MRASLSAIVPATTRLEFGIGVSVGIQRCGSGDSFWSQAAHDGDLLAPGGHFVHAAHVRVTVLLQR